ncbi:HNH endonuclease [Methylobacterium haplocladii]|nr:HNH endonuclease [Methylobacterium haplocladii]
MLTHEGWTYVTLMLRIHAQGGPVADDVGSLAAATKLPPRKVAETLAVLGEAGKVVLTVDGRLDMPETHAELAWRGSHAAHLLEPNPYLIGRRAPPNWQALRELVFGRDGSFCRYCLDDEGPFEIDHILARARGGSDHPDNLGVACRPCNRSKGAKLIEEWQQSSSKIAPSAEDIDVL